MTSPISTCTITGSWPDKTDGTPASGHYLVKPVAEALATGALLPVTTTVVTLAERGTGTRELRYVPGSTQWKITELIEGATNPPPYVVTPDADTLDLSTAPRSAPPFVPVTQFVLASSVGQPGGPGGPLESDGTMPPEQVPGGGGGVVSVAAADTTIVVAGTGTHPTLAVGTAIPQASVTGLTGALAAKASASALTDEVARAEAAEAARIALATVTTKGDLILGTGAATVARVPVGSPGDALVADPGAAAGVSYQPIGGGGGSAVKAFTSAVFELEGGSITPPDSGGNWDILLQDPDDPTRMFSRTVPAEVGELLTVNQNDMFKATDSATHLDLGVIVAGEIVRFLSNLDVPARPSTEGDPGWYPNTPDFKYHPAPPEWIAAAIDIAGDATVTVAVVYRGGTGIFYAETGYPFRMSMKNLGVPGTVV